MSAQPVESDGLDPDRPYALWTRDDTDEIVLLPKDYSQYIEDWLGHCGLTADELMAKHDANDFDDSTQRRAWIHIGRFLKEGRHVRPLRLAP